jgi:hypothetical protein
MADNLDTRSCYRCGITFNGWYTYAAGAPCKDCRSILRLEGDKTIWKTTKPARELQAA